MKSTIAFLAVALRLVSAQGSTMTTVVGGGATGAAPSSTPSGSSDAGVVGPADAICGQGFTYCGSMLVEHQGQPAF